MVGSQHKSPPGIVRYVYRNILWMLFILWVALLFMFGTQYFFENRWLKKTIQQHQTEEVSVSLKLELNRMKLNVALMDSTLKALSQNQSTVDEILCNDSVHNVLLKNIIIHYVQSLPDTKVKLFLYDEMKPSLYGQFSFAHSIIDSTELMHLYSDIFQQGNHDVVCGIWNAENGAYLYEKEFFASQGIFVVAVSRLTSLFNQSDSAIQNNLSYLKYRGLVILFFLLLFALFIILLLRRFSVRIQLSVNRFLGDFKQSVRHLKPLNGGQFPFAEFNYLSDEVNAILSLNIKSQRKLQLSNDKFNAIYNNAPVMLVGLDSHGVVKMWNRACELNLDMRREDILNQPVALEHFFTSDKAQEVKESIMVEDSEFKLYNFQTIDGKVHHHHWASFEMKDGWIIWIGYDVSGIMRVQQEIKQKESFLSELLNQIPQPVFYKDVNGVYLGCNQSFADILSIPVDEIVGKTVFEIDQGDNAIKYHQMDLELMEKGGSQQYDYTMYDKRRDVQRYYLFSKSVYRNAEGVADGLIGVMLDISEQKHYQEELKKLNESKDKLFGVIAHDLKSPFGSLMSLSMLLYEEYDDLNDNERKEMIQDIAQGADKLYDLLQNLLYWSQTQISGIQLNRAFVNLSALFDRVKAPAITAIKSKKLVLEVTIDTDLIVFADENLLMIVLRNLLGNAIKFSFPGGLIEVNAHYAAEGVFIQVVDHGVGIAQEKQAYLFELNETKSTYGTQNEKGSGLGLVVCSELVMKMGGHLSVESEKGRGALFSFSLPSNFDSIGKLS